MRFRKANVPTTKIEVQMAPMIDVTFLLLIFFMVTLRVVPSEGDFDVYMPLAAPSSAPADEIQLPPIKVRMRAAADGSLASLQMGQTEIPVDENVYARLNQEVGAMVGGASSQFADELEVEIDTDFNLNYAEVMSAVSACTGYRNPQTGQVTRYLEKIKFSPPRKTGTTP